MGKQQGKEPIDFQENCLQPALLSIDMDGQDGQDI